MRLRARIHSGGLGFSEVAQGEPISSFSGGWRARVALAVVLFSSECAAARLSDEPSRF